MANTKLNHSIIQISLVAVLSFLSINLHAQTTAYTFTPLIVPGVTWVQAPEASSINNQGEIIIRGRAQVGTVKLAIGFLRRVDGTYLQIHNPLWHYTEPVAITDAGQIVGRMRYQDEYGTTMYGVFLRDTDGTFRDVYATKNPDETAYPIDINRSGQISGMLDYDIPCGLYAMILELDGSKNRFNYPGTCSTWHHGINDAGDTVGYAQYQNSTTPPVSFIRRSNGQFVLLPAGVPTDINNVGQILIAGGVRQTDGTITPVKYRFPNVDAILVNGVLTPNPYALQTNSLAINDSGVVVGKYVDAIGGGAFMATPGPIGVAQMADAVKPTCTLTALTPSRIQMAIADRETGIRSIDASNSVNLFVDTKGLVTGTKRFTVNAMKVNPMVLSVLILKVTDVAGNVATCF